MNWTSPKAALLGSVLALSVQPAHANETIASLAALEGRWAGSIAFGSATNRYDVEMSVTGQGAKVSLKSRRITCEFVVSPTISNGVFATFVTRDRTGDCTNSHVSLALDQGDLRLLFEGQETEPGRLVQITGPNAETRTYPDVAIRSIRLGMPFTQLDALVPQGGSITGSKSSHRVMRGIRQLDGTYRQIRMPYNEEDYQAYAQDNIGVYRIPDDANTGAMAITRYYAPSPLSAPKGDVFRNALITAYGEPDTLERSGSRTDMSWHYGLDGTRASGPTKTTCEQKSKYRDTGALLPMKFNSLEFSASGRAREGKSGISVGITAKAGCGYSLKYTTRVNQDGSLEDAEAVYFDHRALAAAAWAETSEKLAKSIATQLTQINAAASNAPEL